MTMILFDHAWPSFKQDQDIIKTIIVTNFDDDHVESISYSICSGELKLSHYDKLKDEHSTSSGKKLHVNHMNHSTVFYWTNISTYHHVLVMDIYLKNTTNESNYIFLDKSIAASLVQRNEIQ